VCATLQLLASALPNIVDDFFIVTVDAGEPPNMLDCAPFVDNTARLPG
jgi:hypothetical protein